MIDKTMYWPLYMHSFAQYNVALLWEQGLGRTPKNTDQAAAWFLRSARQGYPPAMVRLAGIQSSLGNEEPAISWLNLAARWGDQTAISELRRKSLPVPQSDLLQQSIAARERQNQEAIDALMGLIFIGTMVESVGNGNTINPGYLPSQSSTTNTYDSYRPTTSRSSSCVITPDGSFVGGGRGTTMCADGSFVAGNRCQMVPDGSFVGVD